MQATCISYSIYTVFDVRGILRVLGKIGVFHQNYASHTGMETQDMVCKNHA